MATRPTFRLFWRRPLARLGLLALLLAGAATWYVAARGGWVNALHLPPVLDASTPRSQNGYTLTRIETAAGTGEIAFLFVRPPAFPKIMGHYCDSDGYTVYETDFHTVGPLSQATAQTSTGDTTPLGWTIVGDASGPQFYRIAVPGGYSNDCLFLNVTLVPSIGPFPRWRITRLPNMRRAITEAPKLTDSVTKNGATVSVRAWHQWHATVLQTHVQLPPKSRQWEVATADVRSEWETYGTQHGHQGFYVSPLFRRGPVLMDRTVPLLIRLPAPYRSASKFASLDYELREFETYDEPVTFHNVAVQCERESDHVSDVATYYVTLSHPLRVTTPSGIAVTLPTQGQRLNNSREAGAFNLLVSVEPKAQQPEGVLSLKASPLGHAFSKPVKISLALPQTYASVASLPETASQPAWYALSLPRYPAWHFPPKAASPTLNRAKPPPSTDLTIIVHQRVDLQTIPMTFTVPVADTPPPDVH